MDINTDEIKKNVSDKAEGIKNTLGSNPTIQKVFEKAESARSKLENKTGKNLSWKKLGAVLAGIVLVVVVAVNVVGGKTSSFLKNYEKIVVKAEKFAKKGDTKSFTALVNESEKLSKDIIEDMRIGNWSNRKKRKFEKLTERMYDAASKLD